jgi:hypothetical protein
MSRHQTGIAGLGSGLRCSAISAEGIGQDKRLSDGMSAFPPWCTALTTPPYWMTMARVVTRGSATDVACDILDRRLRLEAD